MRRSTFDLQQYRLDTSSLGQESQQEVVRDYRRQQESVQSSHPPNQGKRMGFETSRTLRQEITEQSQAGLDGVRRKGDKRGSLRDPR